MKDLVRSEEFLTLVYIDSLQGMAAASRENALLVTDNPLLADDPLCKGELENIDRFLDQAEANDLGRAALELTGEIDGKIADLISAEQREGKLLSFSVGGSTLRLAATLFYRGAVMAKTLRRVTPEKLVLLVSEDSDGDPANPFSPARFSNPFPALNRFGFFGDLSVETSVIEAALPVSINDTAISEYRPRLAMMPLSVLLYEACRRVGFSGVPWGRRICVGKGNDTVRETLFWLMVRGYKLEEYRYPSVTSADFSSSRNSVYPSVHGALDPWLSERIESFGFFRKCEAEAIAGILKHYISVGIDFLKQNAEQLERQAEQVAAGSRVLITNGMFGPVGTYFYSLCREKGVRVISFEHGVTAGLSAGTQFRMPYTEAVAADTVLVCSDKSAAAFERAAPKQDCVYAPIGLADQTRHLLRPKWQRRFARERLGLDAHEPVVMHVSTYLYSGNMRTAPYIPTETFVYEFDRKIIQDVYSQIRHKVVFKQYPSQRLPHEPDYDDAMSPRSGVVIAKNEDFRYIRAAADVIVTTTPTSTLGWCVGANIPIVWLDSRVVNPLLDDSLREQFRDSFLTIDIDQDDWMDCLRELLDRDVVKIREDWMLKVEKRKVLLREAVIGPKGIVGRRAAATVNRLYSQAMSSPVTAVMQ